MTPPPPPDFADSIGERTGGQSIISCPPHNLANHNFKFENEFNSANCSLIQLSSVLCLKYGWKVHKFVYDKHANW